jgi:exportin-2 (importin alpha re-exporter)
LLTIVGRLRPGAFTALVKLFQEPQHLESRGTDESVQTGLTEIDYEEQTAGYQAAYSRLAASESAAADPVAYVREPRDFLIQEIARRAGTNGPQLKQMLEATGDVGRPYL